MNKIIEALSKLLPEEQVKELSVAVEEMLGESKQELQAEFDAKLEEAYGELASEVKEAEKVAETGYQEAYTIITDLRNRLDTQRAEFDAALDEGYEEAYQMLQSERGKKESVETELYEEYDKKLADMKEYMIDKIDQFLQFKGKDIYEQARRDVMNDPRMVEHKVALSKVVETVQDYISDEDYALATNAKLEEAAKANEELKAQLRITEARNIRLSTENNKLTESVKQTAGLLKEHNTVVTESAKNEREEKAKKAQGRGEQVVENVRVIGEPKDKKSTEGKGEETLAEHTDEMRHWQVLSGLKNDE